MSFQYGPYSSGGGASLTDAEWGEFAKGLLGTGVIKGALIAGSAGNDFAVTAPGTGMTCDVGTGQAMVYGHWCENDASSSQTITAADPTNPRIDRVVLQHDVTAKTVSILVVAGTPAASPTAPTLTQTPSTWQMSLCQVAVGAGVSSISSGNITDERTYASPALHAAAHASGGSDPITPASIGAAALSGATFTGAVSTTALTTTSSGNVIAAGDVRLGAGVGGSLSRISYDAANDVNDYYAPQSGAAAQSHQFVTWDGSASKIPFAVGQQVFARSYVDNTGHFHDATGPVLAGAAGLTGKISAQSTAPSSPADGDLWLDTSIVL